MQAGPLAAGARRPEVRSAVLLGTADQGWRDRGRLLHPRLCARPSALAHEIFEALAHCPGALRGRLGPDEVREGTRPERDDDEPGPELRDAEVARVEELRRDAESQVTK